MKFARPVVQFRRALVQFVAAFEQFDLVFVQALGVAVIALRFIVDVVQVKGQVLRLGDGFRELRIGRRQGFQFGFQFVAPPDRLFSNVPGQGVRALHEPFGQGLHLFLSFGQFARAFFDLAGAVVDLFDAPDRSCPAFDRLTEPVGYLQRPFLRTPGPFAEQPGARGGRAKPSRICETPFAARSRPGPRRFSS